MPDEKTTVTEVVTGLGMTGASSVDADLAAGTCRDVAGEIEVRWSHGRFSAVEAKLHLETAPDEVPGYFPLG